jgi:hypothetical protein
VDFITDRIELLRINSINKFTIICLNNLLKLYAIFSRNKYKLHSADLILKGTYLRNILAAICNFMDLLGNRYCTLRNRNSYRAEINHYVNC